ncbi:TPA: hypothetical protein ACPZFM_001682 [Yersinia enterocolitica]|nr:hypothetical protein [Yersinia enterocolitica]HDL7190916.1 hypothetical protein [Yersinia enterocolitica]HEB2010907.1 hypothetical protein [Yersinia enterocolitica]
MSFQLKFEQKGDFQAWYACQAWLNDGNIFNAKYIDIHNGRWLPLYSQGYIDFLIAQLEAANEKLSKPVVLPVGYAVRAGHPINEGERNVMIPKEGGNWLSRFDVEHAIRVAGFTVEGE